MTVTSYLFFYWALCAVIFRFYNPMMGKALWYSRS